MQLKPIQKVLPGSVLSETIFVKGKPIHLKGKALSLRDLQNLKTLGVRSIRIIPPVQPPPAEREFSQQVREETVELVYNVLNDFENMSSKRLETVKGAANKLVDEVLDLDDINIQSHELRTFDDYTYRHSVNVTIVATAIAHQLNYSKTDLRLLATGALMHDIGKMKIPTEILNKEDKLTHSEMDTVARHPVDGFNILHEKTHSDPVIWSIARHHHEAMDGSGYPDGKRGGQIHPFARIVAVADIWDALRSNRPYKNGWTINQVLEFLNSPKMQTKLDPEARVLLSDIARQ